jgi:hypothetical protein
MPTTGTETLFYINVTSITSDVFFQTPLKKWICLHYQVWSPLETSSKHTPDDVNSETYQYTVLVHIHIKYPNVEHNAQNNNHTYYNTSGTNLYFDFFYNAFHNKINESIIYTYMDPELFVISVTVNVTNNMKISTISSITKHASSFVRALNGHTIFHPCSITFIYLYEKFVVVLMLPPSFHDRSSWWNCVSRHHRHNSPTSTNPLFRSRKYTAWHVKGKQV